MPCIVTDIHQNSVFFHEDGARVPPKRWSLIIKLHALIIIWFSFIFSGSAAQRGLWPPRSRCFLITHNNAPQSVGLLWTSDQLVAETSTWQCTTVKTNIYGQARIRTRNPSKPSTADPRLGPCGHWDRLGPAGTGTCKPYTMQKPNDMRNFSFTQR
jgi:hypothetical protein